jgi:cellulose biosynthesis protein BcsQ
VNEEFNPNFCCNEREVESKLIISYLLPALGYSINMWRQEVNYHRFRLDFLTVHDSISSVVIEAKHPNKILNDHLEQISQYMIDLNIKYGLLTNGREIRIYENRENIIQLIFQCFGHGIEKRIETIKSLIGRETLLKLPAQEQKIMKVIAIYHNKGGVGKTTTTVNLAATLSKLGKKLLIIDMDSQANTTFATGLINFGDEEKDNLKDSYIYHILRYSDSFTIPEVIRKSRFSSHEIDVIPAHIHLMQQENELNQLDYSKLMLLQKLELVKPDYDIVLIDTPPSLNLYARIALITTDFLIIPSDLKPFANEGLENVKVFVNEINAYRKLIHRPAIEVMGVLPTKISTNAKFVQSTLKRRLALIPERYQVPIMDSIIYERDELAKCIEQTLTVGELEVADPRSIVDFKNDSKSIEEFQDLAQEVLQRIGLN